MVEYPSRRDRKLREQQIMDRENMAEAKLEEKVEREVDVLKLPSRSEIYGRKEKQRKGRASIEDRGEEAELEDEEQIYTIPQRKKKSFPLVNLLFILFFLIVLAVSTYPLWIEKLF